MLDDLTTAASSPTVWPAAYPQGYAGVDVETTGLARDDRIISAAPRMGGRRQGEGSVLGGLGGLLDGDG